MGEFLIQFSSFAAFISVLYGISCIVLLCGGCCNIRASLFLAGRRAKEMEELDHLTSQVVAQTLTIGFDAQQRHGRTLVLGRPDGRKIEVHTLRYAVLKMGLMVADVATDLNSSRIFYEAGCHACGAIALTVSLLSIAATFPSWRRFHREMAESKRRGWYTSDLMRIRETERSLEAVPQLVLSVIGLPYVARSSWTAFQQTLGMALSAFTISKFLTERQTGV